MAQHIVDLLRSLLAHYGYGAVAGALLLENAGLPVPGETVLLLASFLAYSEHRLRLPYIILIGICAATVGDNLNQNDVRKPETMFRVSQETKIGRAHV